MRTAMQMSDFLPRFNPAARIEAVPLHPVHLPGQVCLVVDELLLNPEVLVELAVMWRAHFQDPHASAYPGLELWMPPAVSGLLDDWFRLHVRARLGGRRSLRLDCRLSMVTLPADALQPKQWFCHRDDPGRDPKLMRAASVLYLFHESAYGGTSLYRPLRPMDEIERLVHDAGHLDAASFRARWPEVAPGYMHDSNVFFERVLQVPARFNRAVFYDGGVFHCSDNGPAGELPDDPRTGRLTLNGFFSCTRVAR
jgi:hypothetical protein